MDWQEYVDGLTKGGKIAQAAILGSDGSSLANSPNFKLPSQDVQNILAVFNYSADASTKGLHVNGNNYSVVKVDEVSIYGMKGPEGVIIFKTGTCLIIGFYVDGQTPAEAVSYVGKTADYLKALGL